ncbi:MAG: peptide MFS transporter [Nitrospinae bacterium]|nr:peptide MFS transporter [Nitrospinota bacterium]
MSLPLKTTQPQGLYILFFAELWERFSFYGMRALLTLYMAKELLYADEKAYGVYGAYGALVYTTPVLGGLIADKILGRRKAITLGAVIMAMGHFTMALNTEFTFYIALSLLIIGNGFFKPNISSLLGKLYEEEDPRRDGGFTIFYMGINIGALLAPLGCGAIGELYGWHYGFGLAGIGMIAGLLVFRAGEKKFGQKGMPPNPEKLAKKIFAGTSLEQLIVAGSFLSAPLFALLVRQNQVMSYLLGVMGVVIFGSLFLTALRSERVEREKIFVILVLSFFSVLFWSFFEQAGSSITLFTDRNVDRNLFGLEIPASLFQGVNPAFIILLAMPFSNIWIFLSKAGREPSMPMKFAIGTMQLGLGFWIFVLGAWFAGGDGIVPMAFLLAGYFLQTTGELCLSPVGLSMVTKLAPGKIVGFVMGTWFLSTAFAHHIAGLIAKMTAPAGMNGETAMSAAGSLPNYARVFGGIGLVAAGAGLLLLLLVPLLRRWMHGVH